MENQNQQVTTNQQTSDQPTNNTPTSEPQSGIMTIGDFLSQNSEPSQTSQPNVMTVTDFNNGTTTPTPKPDFTPLPVEAKPNFIESMKDRFWGGMLVGDVSNETAYSMGLVKYIPGAPERLKGELQQAQTIYNQTKSDNPIIEGANKLAGQLGYMGVTIPVDFAVGKLAMRGLAGKVLPSVMTALSKIPAFVLGSGFRGLSTSLQESQQKNENPLIATSKAIGTAAFNVVSNTAFAKIGGGWKGATTLTVLGGATAYAEAATQGRIATKDEVESGMVSGLGMGLVFTILPHLTEGSQVPTEKTALGEYTGVLETQVKENNLQGVKNTVEAMTTDTAIRPEIRDVIVTTAQLKPRYSGKIDEQGNLVWEPKTEEQPVKTGPEVKPSGLSQSVVSDAIKVGLKEEDLKNISLPSHEVRNMDQVGERASEFINNDHELAMKIAKGEAPEQDDLRSQELFTALRIKAQVEGDTDTLLELARSDKAANMATELGQRIKALDSHDPNDIVKSIREVNKVREVEANKVSKKVKSETDKGLKVVNKEISKLNNKLKAWKDLIDSIEC